MTNLKIRQCRICTKPFQTLGASICSGCASELDSSFIKVREYLYSEPEKKDISSISEATGVNEKMILYLLREGKLTAGFAGTLKCENCGSPIQKGRLCDSCTQAIKKMGQTVRQQQQITKKRGADESFKSGSKMYTNG